MTEYYRLTNRVGAQFEVDTMCEQGDLVPVTIDYEAAATQLQSAEIDPHGTWLGWAKIIVDAAVKEET